MNTNSFNCGVNEKMPMQAYGKEHDFVDFIDVRDSNSGLAELLKLENEDFSGSPANIHKQS
jgi:hypothetical protein